MSRNTEPRRTVDYVRTARRLRARHGRNRETLHRELTAAARQFDEDADATRDRREMPSAVEAFERVVARRVREPVLRYSVRLELVSVAERLGVGRFEANLIIATQQHRSREFALFAATDDSSRLSRTGFVGACVLAAVMLQSLIVWGAYHVVALTR